MILEILVRYHKPFDCNGRITKEYISEEYVRILKKGKKRTYCKGLMLVGKNEQHNIRRTTYDAQKRQGVWKSLKELNPDLRNRFIEELPYTQTKNKIYKEILEYVYFTL